MTRCSALVSAAVMMTSTLSAQTPQAAPQKFPLAAYLTRGHESVQRNLNEAAEKMPEEHYTFKPTPEMRPYGQVVAHIALSRFSACSALKGQTNPHAGEKEDKPRTKAEAVALLKEAGSYCSEAFKELTDDSINVLTKVGPAQTEVAKGVFAAGENAHGNEVYGTMAVYLRLKGLVPPSTERTQKK